MSQAHADTASHGSVKSYMIGFLLSVILTGIPFWMVMSGAFTPRETMTRIFALAVVQIVVHLKFFLHLDFTREGRLNSFAFLFTAMVIVMLVGLSVWIISSADLLMMR